jgi:hypothetical protein
MKIIIKTANMYSKLPIIQHVWEMGSTGYVNLLVVWEKLLHKPNIQSKKHAFTSVLMRDSLRVM